MLRKATSAEVDESYVCQPVVSILEFEAVFELFPVPLELKGPVLAFPLVGLFVFVEPFVVPALFVFGVEFVFEKTFVFVSELMFAAELAFEPEFTFPFAGPVSCPSKYTA